MVNHSDCEKTAIELEDVMYIPCLGVPAPVGLAAPVRAKAPPMSTVPTPRRLPVDISDLKGDKQAS